MQIIASKLNHKTNLRIQFILFLNTLNIYLSQNGKFMSATLFKMKANLFFKMTKFIYNLNFPHATLAQAPIFA